MTSQQSANIRMLKLIADSPGHELHHYLNRYQMKVTNPSPRSSVEATVALTTLENEGLIEGTGRGIDRRFTVTKKGRVTRNKY